jgi:hypothetical protein
VSGCIASLPKLSGVTFDTTRTKENLEGHEEKHLMKKGNYAKCVVPLFIDPSFFVAFVSKM